MFCSIPENPSALEQIVVRAAELHERRVSPSHYYSRFFHLGDFDKSYPNLSVKYDNLVPIECEYSMLKHLYALACDNGDSAPHIPRPFHFFYHGREWGPWGYIVMERISTCDVSEEELCMKTAEVVRWLHAKHPPEGATFGTIGPTPSYPYHRIFKYRKAPRKFNTVISVEKYLNLAVPWASKMFKKSLSPISLANDEVVLSQSHMDPSNFGVAQDGRPIIFGASSIHAMPLALANLTILRSDVSKYVFSIHEREELLRSPTMQSLYQVMKFFFTFCEFIPKGLDDDGNVQVAEAVGMS